MVITFDVSENQINFSEYKHCITMYKNSIFSSNLIFPKKVLFWLIFEFRAKKSRDFFRAKIQIHNFEKYVISVFFEFLRLKKGHFSLIAEISILARKFEVFKFSNQIASNFNFTILDS